MVGAAVEIVFPGPFVFEGHELVDVDLVAVDQSFFIDFYPFVLMSFSFLFLTLQMSTCLSPLLAAFTAFFQVADDGFIFAGFRSTR